VNAPVHSLLAQVGWHVNIGDQLRSLKEQKPRAYQLRARADKQAATHRALAKAAFELHSTVGPAKTTISAIAEQAGVQRLTVYRHFADQDAIFAACVAHAFELDPPPDPQAWTPINEPEARLRAALTATYQYYRRNQRLLANINRDAELPAVAKRLAHNAEMQLASVAVLCAGWTGADDRMLAAMIGHALDFSTWRSLAERRGLSDAEATEAMTVLVRGVVSASAAGVRGSIAG
jgi:AcrR family transcriptional regulator